MRTVLLAGATGLVGQAILDLYDPALMTLVTVGRRQTQKVDTEIETDFIEPLELPPADIAICALGTTLARAGSKSAFRAVDYDTVMAFAEAARQAGVRHFLLVSAVGANPKARVFYSRVKGEVERDLQRLKFNRLDIAQPGLLIGARQERRPVEKMLQRADPMLRPFLKGPLDRYTGIRASTVAAAMLRLCGESASGTYHHENRAMERLALA